jgi:ribosomal protein S18 acetylase RimI-like enzyme
MITLEHAPTVSVVSPAQEEFALAPLVLAFANDPAARWLFPDAHQFRIFFPCFVRAFAGKAFALGAAQRVDGFRGIALWLPPSVVPDDHALVPLIEETVRPERRANVFALFEKMDSQHPTQAHWYLPLIGIDPHHQGQGLGSALLSHTLAACDREGALAYLEASNPRNVALYARHGFEVRGEIQVGDSPTLFAMVRVPR